ncbi:hypothetical protein DEU56DRAFT_897264 [Suillus clintonianus]|uniref:uncharacterized protein n=1 Tax=Suillus clintonianus TaxID=1904413 RepID=UPI001B869ACD|nr:uncharacterized protein DEU56DRAFT_897264 [Suillus clintonianus]KAG2156232.1 hypothetical protein DEU56DRAFT_897264 [Suillus clintonianus]
MGFKGFKYGTNRFSIRGFLAAISRLFMAIPSDAPGVFTAGGSKNEVETWHVIVSNSDLSSQCQLDKMVYCKCTEGKQHEFLLLYFRHPIQQHAVSILVLDRTPCTDDTQNNNGGSSRQNRQSSSIVSPSVYPTSAHDSVFTTRNEGSAIPSYLDDTYGSYKNLIDLEFSASARPSAIQVSALLSALSKHSPLYDLYQYQCYWYAHTVWEALKKLFPGCKETTRCQGRSSYHGLKIEKADSVDVVCEQYRIRWAGIENAAEERRKAKEDEVRQLRMEGRAEERAQCQTEIEQALAEAARNAEESARNAEEAARNAEEVVRQKEEVARTQRAMAENQAEMDRMRARLAQLERQAA